MWQSNFFRISERPTPEIVDLLTEVTLGTTGIRYKHLDTAQRVHQVDHPLFFYLQRNEKVLGNMTLCQRNNDWYVRYFAFRTSLQRNTDTKSEDKSSNFLKREIESFFQAAFQGEINGTKVENFYAFIDPKNDRSKWMSRNFGFKTVAQLSTQTFSRWFAKKSPRFAVTDVPTEDLLQKLDEQFKHHAFYFDFYHSKAPIATIIGENGEIIAFARLSIAHWHIESLGGKAGKLKAQLLSHIPFVNRLVNPKKHTFSVPDSVWVKDNDARLLSELFESIIAYQKSNMLIWWVDNKEPLYIKTKSTLKWGPLHPILGVSPVDVVLRNHSADEKELTNPLYVVGIDAI